MISPAVAAAVRERALIRGVARSLLATAHLGTLALTPSRMLLARPPDEPAGAGCEGVRGLSLWCVTGSGPALVEVVRWAAAGVLVAVAAGYRPRWTCLPHFWVAFSLHAGLAFPNGGEYAAQLAVMLLVPACLTDGRTWQWSRSTAPAPAWRGAVRAAQLVARWQVLVIYAWAATAKLSQPAWRDGSAMRAILRDPIYGAPDAVRHVTDRLLGPAPVAAALTWLVLAVELLIAVSMLGGPRPRWVAAGLALVLHSAIIGVMGLFGFGLTMIGFVLLTCDDAVPSGAVGRSAAPDRLRTGPAEAVGEGSG